MNRIDRLLGVILLLQSRRVITAEQIAAHFETSVRTVYRDLSALSEIGVPFAAEPGVGYILLKGYHLPPVMFSEAEAAALFTAGELTKQFADSSLAKPAESALLKIRAVLPAVQREQAERMLQHTAVLGWPRQPALLDRELLLPIQRAVALRRVLHLEYRAKGRERSTSREVEPLGVVYFANAWYLIAWCRLRKDFRHFRIDRIRQVAVRKETFAPRPGFSLRAHLAESVQKEDTVHARVRFTPDAAERARNECFAGLAGERPVGDLVEMDFLTFSLEWLAGWLLSFGTDATAMAPERLRELVKERAEQIVQLY